MKPFCTTCSRFTMEAGAAELRFGMTMALMCTLWLSTTGSRMSFIRPELALRRTT